MRIATLAAITLALMLTAAAPVAGAATITVGVAGCTLVDAIAAANTDAPSGTCTGAAITGVFSPGGADTIVLTADVTLSVPADGANGNGVVVVSDITIEGNGHTIQRNLAFACPGGADPDFRIFGVSSGGSLTLNDVTLQNGCPGLLGGGSGGAIRVANSSLALNRSTIKNNRAPDGGGLSVLASSTATVVDSVFVDNHAGIGGASGFGGASTTIGVGSSLTYISSTLVGNTAEQGGGAVDMTGGTTLVSSTTVARNTDVDGGDGFNVAGGALQLVNAIVDNPGSGDNCSVGGGTITSLGHNLATDFSCALTAPGDLPGTPSGLGPLVTFPTPGKTHVALTAGSGAVNSGDSCPPTDQLGHGRLGACDRGAVEFGIPTVLTLTAEKDSSLRSDDKHANEGANPRLHLRAPGKRRVVAAFDLSTIDLAGVLRARLVLTIAANSNDWNGGNKLVDAHPLLQDFTEGNGALAGVAAPNRGTGAGTTWKCPTDTNIANTVRNCATIWDGGLFDPATAPGVVHTNGLLGDVEWDVTDDVLAGHDAWLIKKRKEGAPQPGSVRYYSREGSLAVFGDESRAPRLILELQ